MIRRPTRTTRTYTLLPFTTLFRSMIETAMTDALNEQQRARILTAIPMQRLGKPDEISAAVAYLASEEAAYVTGQNFPVNGGIAMILRLRWTHFPLASVGLWSIFQNLFMCCRLS